MKTQDRFALDNTIGFVDGVLEILIDDNNEWRTDLSGADVIEELTRLVIACGLAEGVKEPGTQARRWADEAADDHTGTRMEDAAAGAAMPRIYVWCNNCSPEWHVFEAISEDGCFLGGHVCSSHFWARHDMGIDPDGWKRDVYARYYPDGFEVVMVENPKTHAGFQAAYEAHRALSQEEYDAMAKRAFPAGVKT